MTRKEILEAAAAIVTQDREEQYGPAEDNFALIGDLWSIYVGGDVEFTAQDVAIMMALLKIARIATGQPKADNFVDIAGYAACAGEIATGGAEDAEAQ